MTTTAEMLAMADKLESIISAQVLDEAAALLRKLAEEREDMNSTIVAFASPQAASYGKSFGWPDGHLHPTHYNILEKAGARLVDFVRHDVADLPPVEA